MYDLSAKETGKLGVLHLGRFYERSLSQRRGIHLELTEEDVRFDKVVLSGLGLPLELTIRYLNEHEPTFAEFEKWIIAINRGRVEPSAIQRINRALSGRPWDEETSRLLEKVDASEDVLTAEDLRFWEKNGYVIVKEAVSCEDAQAAENAVWEFLGMSPENPSSWYEKPIGKGIMMELYHHPALSRTRHSLQIHKAFAQIWNRSDLWLTVDRSSFNPPENERYRFQGPRLHWDMSLAPPHYFGTQGILYLCDNAIDKGALSCVPGFQNELESWLASLPPCKDRRQVDLDDRAVCVPASAGDLIIWHQSLPHGSSPNRRNYPRIAQYINMFPLDHRENLTWL